MSRDWARELSKGWPSGKPWWTLLSLAIAMFSVGVIGFVEIATMTPLERYYLGEYTRAGTAAMSGLKTGRYRLLNVVEKRGQKRLAIERDLEPGATANYDQQIIPFTLSPAARSESASLVPQVRVHRLDANLGLGLTRAEEHAGLGTRHFELAISSRPLRFNPDHTHLAEGVMPKTAPLPIAGVTHNPRFTGLRCR